MHLFDDGSHGDEEDACGRSLDVEADDDHDDVKEALEELEEGLRFLPCQLDGDPGDDTEGDDTHEV